MTYSDLNDRGTMIDFDEDTEWWRLGFEFFEVTTSGTTEYIRCIEERDLPSKPVVAPAWSTGPNDLETVKDESESSRWASCRMTPTS